MKKETKIMMLSLLLSFFTLSLFAGDGGGKCDKEKTCTVTVGDNGGKCD